MIFVLTEEGMESARKTAQIVAQDSELFKAFGIAALKARAKSLEPGNVLKLGGFEFVVDEDELGVWIVVNIILPRKDIEAMAEVKAEDLGVDIKIMDSSERSIWRDSFIENVSAFIKNRYEIKCIQGPGENLTFEKSVYKKESRAWR
jgi:hypothetical protein